MGLMASVAGTFFFLYEMLQVPLPTFL